MIKTKIYQNHSKPLHVSSLLPGGLPFKQLRQKAQVVRDAVVKYTGFKGLKVEGGCLTLVARCRREAVSNIL